MTLETIYYIGQTIAVLAILASLVFVGVQIKQNTAQAKADAADKAHQTFNNWYENVTPDTSDLVFRAVQDADSLSPAEKFRVIAYLTPMIVNLQEVHSKWRDGSFPEDRWQFWDRWISYSISPLLARYWEDRRLMFSERFREYMDEKIATHGSATKKGSIGAVLEEPRADTGGLSDPESTPGEESST